MRPILMTSCAMIAGMIPMGGSGPGWGPGRPLGRGDRRVNRHADHAFVLPAVFALVAGRADGFGVLDPFDPASPHHVLTPNQATRGSPCVVTR